LERGKIIVCSAPSGAGKTTLLEYLRREIPCLAYSVSATTRNPRPGERDGEQYFFLSQDEFKRRIDLGEFAEWQIVHGNYYGTPCSFIEKTVNAGTHLIMDIDVHGKVMLNKTYPDALGIIILPPSFEVLEQRLRGRKTEKEKDIIIRMENARKEVEFAHTSGNYQYTIINNDIHTAEKEIVEIVGEITGLNKMPLNNI
jgi:guanylate kinase